MFHKSGEKDQRGLWAGPKEIASFDQVIQVILAQPLQIKSIHLLKLNRSVIDFNDFQFDHILN